MQSNHKIKISKYHDDKSTTKSAGRIYSGTYSHYRNCSCMLWHLCPMHILTALYMSLWCVAIYELQDTGMPLNFIRKAFHKWRDGIDRGQSKIARSLYTFLSKPMSTCVICFSSAWAALPYFYFGGSVSLDWLYCSVICSLFNYIIYCAIRILEKI